MNTLKQVTLSLALLVSLSGCGYVERFAAKATGYSTQCVNGVEYIQFTSGASVAYTQDGKVKTC